MFYNYEDYGSNPVSQLTKNNAHPKFIELAVNLAESLTLGDRLLDMNES